MLIKAGMEIVTEMHINVCTEVAAKCLLRAGTEIVT